MKKIENLLFGALTVVFLCLSVLFYLGKIETVANSPSNSEVCAVCCLLYAGGFVVVLLAKPFNSLSWSWN